MKKKSDNELIRVGDIKGIIERYQDALPLSCYYSEIEKASIRGFLKVLEGEIHELPTIEQPTWISCAERLPTEGGTYLVCQGFDVWGKEHKVIGIEQFVKQLDGWFCDGAKITGITHWMQLPKLPKEDKE